MAYFLVLLAIVLGEVLCPHAISAQNGILYEVQKIGKHQAHILTIDPTKFDLVYALAQGNVHGRETLPTIAKRYGARAAMNAGFFHMGGAKDGLPAGIAKIEGQWASLSVKERGAMGWRGNTLFFDRLRVSGAIVTALGLSPSRL